MSGVVVSRFAICSCEFAGEVGSGELGFAPVFTLCPLSACSYPSHFRPVDVHLRPVWSISTMSRIRVALGLTSWFLFSTLHAPYLEARSVVLQSHMVRGVWDWCQATLRILPDAVDQMLGHPRVLPSDLGKSINIRKYKK